MTQPLEAFVQFEKSIRKMVEKKAKGVRKSAKKARKNKKRELPTEEAREQIDEIFSLLEKHVDTAVSREFGEATTRVDLVLDDDVLLEQVPPRLLVALRKPVKRIRKASRALVKLHGDEFQELASRASRLQEAIDAALERANATPVDERQASKALVDYLRGT
jgi:uncharacterized FlaG/YvyC family protein